MNGVKVADETLEIDGIVTVKNVSRVLQRQSCGIKPVVIGSLVQNASLLKLMV
jgi:hypothetical protein